jgi:hypothetical protein
MTKQELIDKISDGIIHQEGFLLTPLDAKNCNLSWPCIAQIYCNIGNIREWSKDGKKYPTSNGYVDFFRWASGNVQLALRESYRVLKLQVGFYIDGKLHNGVSPTLTQMFEVYAPSADNNLPLEYAKNVAKLAKIPMDKPLLSLITL